MGAQQSSSNNIGAHANKPSKRCYYEILGVDCLASDVDIKRAYRKRAFELHPDRNFGDSENATVKFAEVQSAYEVLGDSQERAWYDSYRDSLLQENNSSSGERFGPEIQFNSAIAVIGLTNRFTKSMPYTDGDSGFYGIFGKVFADIAIEENLISHSNGSNSVYYPNFGTVDDDYEVSVKIFYNIWINFSTQKTFDCKNEFQLSVTHDRARRRLMEKEKKKFREKSRKEFNNAVRALVIFVRKRDPRYIPNLQTNESRQRDLRCAAAAQAARSRAENQAKLDNHVIPNWARIYEPNEEEVFSGSEEIEKECIECVVCRKIFKSEKQFEAHEKSKKHIKAVKELRKELQQEKKLLNMEHQSDIDSKCLKPREI